MKFKKIVIRKTDNKQDIHYEDERGIIYKELNDDDFNAILEKLKFNNDFALPDRLVQDFVNDGSIMPTFKRSIFFNKFDMEELVKNIKPYRKKRKNLKAKTKKNPKKKNTKKTPKKNIK
jgi:hypothetical protein